MCPPVHNCRQVLDVAIGLEHLHSLKIVHGDLKAVRSPVCIGRLQTNPLIDQRSCDVFWSRSAGGFRAIVGYRGLWNPCVIIQHQFRWDHEMASTRDPPWTSKHCCVRRVCICLCLLRGSFHEVHIWDLLSKIYHYRYSRRKSHSLKSWSAQSSCTSLTVTSHRNYPACRTMPGSSWKNVGEPNRGNVLGPNRLLRGSAIRP
jgi:serine/threonine protein kinase